jgi:hypothetical protein
MRFNFNKHPQGIALAGHFNNDGIELGQVLRTDDRGSLAISRTVHSTVAFRHSAAQSRRNQLANLFTLPRDQLLVGIVLMEAWAIERRMIDRSKPFNPRAGMRTRQPELPLLQIKRLIVPIRIKLCTPHLVHALMLGPAEAHRGSKPNV